MNIDERLEALTHTVELLAQMHKDNEKRMVRTDQQIKRLGRYIQSIALLSVDHEDRLQELEGNDENDENDDEAPAEQ